MIGADAPTALAARLVETVLRVMPLDLPASLALLVLVLFPMVLFRMVSFATVLALRLFAVLILVRIVLDIRIAAGLFDLAALGALVHVRRVLVFVVFAAHWSAPYACVTPKNGAGLIGFPSTRLLNGTDIAIKRRIVVPFDVVP